MTDRFIIAVIYLTGCIVSLIFNFAYSYCKIIKSWHTIHHEIKLGEVIEEMDEFIIHSLSWLTALMYLLFVLTYLGKFLQSYLANKFGNITIRKERNWELDKDINENEKKEN